MDDNSLHVGKALGRIEDHANRSTVVNADAPRLRLATYNIHKGVLLDYVSLRYVSRIHELRTQLHCLEGDLVFLQEVQGRHDGYAKRLPGWPREPQDAFLAQRASAKTLHSVYGQNASYLHGHHGNALLSRYPLQRRENRDISDHALERRGILYCTAQIYHTTVHCFVVHFGLLARSRLRQLEALVSWIESTVAATEPLIIAGDFNDWRNQLSAPLCERINVIEVFDAVRRWPADLMATSTAATDKRLDKQCVSSHMGGLQPRFSWAKTGKRSIHTARTFPALAPLFRMDRIYLRGFSVQNVTVPWGNRWARLSDHCPVVADVSLVWNSPPKISDGCLN